MQPEPVFGGLMDRLEFAPFVRRESGFAHIEIPRTTLGELAEWIQTRLQTANVSVVGERDMPVRSVGEPLRSRQPCGTRRYSSP